MIISANKIATVVLVGALGLLAAASIAWACSPQSTLFGIAPVVGPPGTEVNMQGEGVPPGTAVEIRWNSPSGEKLGQAVSGADGRFTVAVPVPDVSPDVYYLLAVPAGSGTGLARNAFEVTEVAAGVSVDHSQGSAVSKTADGLWSGFGTGSESSALGGAPISSPDESPSLAMGAGLGLSGLGLVALIGGGAALVRRRSHTV